jgi:hypothetical protein
MLFLLTQRNTERNRVLKYSLLQKHTTPNIHKTLARPVLTYGSEAYMIRKADGKNE